MSRRPRTTYRPGERDGRPQLTPQGARLMTDRVTAIREVHLPSLRDVLVDKDADERDLAAFERLLAEAAHLDSVLAQADLLDLDPAAHDGRVGIGMRVRVRLEDGSAAWVRPVHPHEAALDDERISATSPLALALLGARVGQTVWVSAPSGVWASQVLEIDPTG